MCTTDFLTLILKIPTLLLVAIVSDLNVLGQSPRHNMWLLQYTLYGLILFNTDCYNLYYVKIFDSEFH